MMTMIAYALLQSRRLTAAGRKKESEYFTAASPTVFQMLSLGSYNGTIFHLGQACDGGNL
jgi:hypothetical protein